MDLIIRFLRKLRTTKAYQLEEQAHGRGKRICMHCSNAKPVDHAAIVDHVFTQHRSTTMTRKNKYFVQEDEQLVCLCNKTFTGLCTLAFVQHLWTCQLKPQKRFPTALIEHANAFAQQNALPSIEQQQEMNFELSKPTVRDINEAGGSKDEEPPAQQANDAEQANEADQPSRPLSPLAVNEVQNVYNMIRNIFEPPRLGQAREPLMYIDDFIRRITTKTTNFFTHRGNALKRPPQTCTYCSQVREDEARHKYGDNWQEHYAPLVIGYHQIVPHCTRQHMQLYHCYICTCGEKFHLARDNVLWFLQYIKHITCCHFSSTEKAFERFKQDIAWECQLLSLPNPYDKNTKPPQLRAPDGTPIDGPFTENRCYNQNIHMIIYDTAKAMEEQRKFVPDKSQRTFERIMKYEFYDSFVERENGPLYTENNKFHCRGCQLAWNNRIQYIDNDIKRNNRDFMSIDEYLENYGQPRNWGLNRPADADYVELFDTDIGLYGWMIDILAYMNGKSHNTFTGPDRMYRMVFYHMSIYRGQARSILEYCKDRTESIMLLPNSCLCKRAKKSTANDPLDLRNTHRHVIIIFRNVSVYEDFINQQFELSEDILREQQDLIETENCTLQRERDRLMHANGKESRVHEQMKQVHSPKLQYWEDGYIEKKFEEAVKDTIEQEQSYTKAKQMIGNQSNRLRAKNRYMSEIVTNWHMGNTIRYISTRKWTLYEKKTNFNSLVTLNEYSEHRSWEHHEILNAKLNQLEAIDQTNEYNKESLEKDDTDNSFKLDDDGIHFNFTRPVLPHFKPLLYTLYQRGFTNWLAETKIRNPVKLYKLFQHVHCNSNKDTNHLSYDYVLMRTAKKYLPTYLYRHLIPLNNSAERSDLQKSLIHAISLGAILSPNIDQQYEYFKDLEHTYIQLGHFFMRDFREWIKAHKDMFDMMVSSQDQMTEIIAQVKKCIYILIDQAKAFSRLYTQKDELVLCIRRTIENYIQTNMESHDIKLKEEMKLTFNKLMTEIDKVIYEFFNKQIVPITTNTDI